VRESARRLGIDLSTEATIAVVASAGPGLDGRREAVHVVRSPHGQVVTYAVAGESFAGGELRSVLAPDPVVPPGRSVLLQELALAFVSEQDVVGAACLRFEAGSAAVSSTSIGVDATSAWTLDASVTSLYENHVRALFDLPLGAPGLRGGAVASCTVQQAPGMFAALRHCMARDPGARIHLDGLPGHPGTTIGHVSVVSDDAEDSLRRARHAADYLTGTIEE
jgi:5-(carboxyamino)imidazole ribonucleotide synthase